MDWNFVSNSKVEDKPILFQNGSSGSQNVRHVQELFHEDAQVSQSQVKPWWKVQIFVWEPVLFGTWDGVFTSCMINIFGVVLFLRTGWLVGNTGVLLGMFMVTLVVSVALVTVLSGIGVWERCSLGSGGVYSMLSTVLGGRVGGTFGLLYVFGQCVTGAMYITGFAESIADLLDLSNIWAVRGISIAVLMGLLGINLAGVKWIIRLQLLLLAMLAIATMDFVIGTFSHLDPDYGFVGYSEELLRNNTLPDYSPEESFFTVFGVFFPTATGVMAGFNMSGDLQKPASNIPIGSLAALGISWFLYLVFVFLLGAICTREALRFDFMIAEKVALVGLLWLLGLYISSLASCMGSLYGAPRILQCIAQERVIPVLGFLGQGKGPNKTPIAAICLVGLVTMAFILIGQVNVLAPIVTINFMLTYSAVDYAYFSVCMSYDIQQNAKAQHKDISRSPRTSQPLILDRPQNYGTDGPIRGSTNGSLLEFNKDMSQIFHPMVSQDKQEKMKKNRRKEKTLNRSVRLKKVRKPAKETLQDSFMLDFDNSNTTVKEDNDLVSEGKAVGDLANQGPEDQELQDLSTSVGPQTLEANQNGNNYVTASTEQYFTDVEDSLEPRRYGSTERQKSQETEIYAMPTSFYSKLCNHWLSFIGAIISIVIMFVIHWIYALMNIAMALFTYFYIGQMSPGLPLGEYWVQPYEKQIVMPPPFTTVGMATTQLTEENADFASRDRYHCSSVISREDLSRQLN
uniref:Solute carrier family 12 member 8 n=1 Tax=Callorhinchus milii TaxID=7868 RepID=A0A4W3HPW4_CALMI